MMECAVTLLPHPLSPIKPNVSRGATLKETPSTAFTIPSEVKKWVLRFCTSSRWDIAMLLLVGVSGISQPISQEVES